MAGGDAVALRELSDRYGRVVYSFAYRLTHDATLSEECVQDVFVALWRRAPEFDPTRAKLTTSRAWRLPTVDVSVEDDGGTPGHIDTSLASGAFS